LCSGLGPWGTILLDSSYAAPPASPVADAAGGGPVRFRAAAAAAATTASALRALQLQEPVPGSAAASSSSRTRRRRATKLSVSGNGGLPAPPARRLMAFDGAWLARGTEQVVCLSVAGVRGEILVVVCVVCGEVGGGGGGRGRPDVAREEKDGAVLLRA
jgi:hypothetical protein